MSFIPRMKWLNFLAEAAVSNINKVITSPSRHFAIQDRDLTVVGQIYPPHSPKKVNKVIVQRNWTQVFEINSLPLSKKKKKNLNHVASFLFSFKWFSDLTEAAKEVAMLCSWVLPFSWNPAITPSPYQSTAVVHSRAPVPSQKKDTNF